MGIFGKKKPEPMGYGSAITPPPGFMSGMGMPQSQPAMPQMGYDQNAAMQGQSGFAPMNQGMPEKKPGVNWAGIAADFLAGMAGQPGQFAAQQRRIQDDERQFRYAGQLRDQNRQESRENFIFEQDYKRNNPIAPNNDTTADYDYIASKLGKDAADNYLRLKTERPQTTIIDNGDGTKTIYQVPQGGGMPSGAPTAPVGKLRPLGGQPGGNSPFVQ